ALMDFHELVLEDDSWSIGSRNGVSGRIIIVVRVVDSNVGLNNNSNSCIDGSVMSVGGEAFGTSFKLDGSMLWPEVLSSDVIVISLIGDAFAMKQIRVGEDDSVINR
ncbi:hypothetical protein Tco_1266736, partial [Tanacetum coccineum]